MFREHRCLLDESNSFSNIISTVEDTNSENIRSDTEEILNLQSDSISYLIAQSAIAEEEKRDITVSRISEALSNANNSSMPINTDNLTRVRIANPKSVMIGYLNINNIRNKVNDLKELSSRLFPTVLGISETKVDTSFPNASLCIDNYFNPADYRKDRTCNGGGLLVYIRKGTPCKRLKIFEESDIESICF